MNRTKPLPGTIKILTVFFFDGQESKGKESKSLISGRFMGNASCFLSRRCLSCANIVGKVVSGRFE